MLARRNPLENPKVFWTAFWITSAIVGVRAVLASRAPVNDQACGAGCSLAVAGSDGLGALIGGGVTAGVGALAHSPGVKDAGLGIAAAGAAATVVGWGVLWLDLLAHPGSAP